MYEALFHSSQDGILFIDAAGHVLAANPALRALAPVQGAPALADGVVGNGRFFSILADPSQGMAFISRLASEPGTPTSAVFDLADGRSIEITALPLPPNESGAARAILFRDVTARVLASREMEELVEALRATTAVLQQQASELDLLHARAEYLARHDELTGLLNRRAWFAEAAAGAFASMAVLDVDHFKAINDTHGHPAGDAVLREVARRIVASGDIEGFVGRLGGEEFGLVVRAPFGRARTIVSRALAAVRETPIATGGEQLTITLSAGLAAWHTHEPDPGLAAQRTYEAADLALYSAKAAGRDRLVVQALQAA